MRRLCAALLLSVLTVAPDAQVPDSLAGRPALLDTAAAPTPILSVSDSTGRTPRGAVTRALILPGLGQIYNREPLKAPVATALVAGAVTYFVNRQQRYIQFRRAAAYASCLPPEFDPETRPDRIELCAEALASYQDEYDRANEAAGTVRTFASLRSSRQTARSQRDIGGVFVLGAYALQALDAYVSAELADFDVSEDLGVRMVPTPEGPMLGLRVRL